MSEIKILQNRFPAKTIKTIIKLLRIVNFNQPLASITKEIEVIAPEYQWAIGINPTFHIQYQIDCSAILKVGSLALIVWKPKYIEYPIMIQFPEIKQKILNNFTLEIKERTISEARSKLLSEFVQQFYGTYFYSDPQFDTNIVTFVKHYVSKISTVCYWHCLLEDTDRLALTNKEKFASSIRLRITGFKDKYDKQLHIFSLKGTKDSLFSSVRNKWMQIFSFLGMLMIFISVVGCDADDHQGICQYRQSITILGAGIMMGLLGLRLASKKKKPVLPTNQKTE